MSEATRPRQTLDQRRAGHAWRAITGQAEPGTNGRRRYRDESDDYAREAKKLPVRIQASGLGQALAFILAKAKKRPLLAQLHRDLTDWVIRERPLPAGEANSLLESVIAGDSEFLRRATDEVLAYLLWLNRFAEAEGLPGKESDE